MLESKSPDFEAPTTGVVDSGLASVFLFNCLWGGLPTRRASGFPECQAESLTYFFLLFSMISRASTIPQREAPR